MPKSFFDPHQRAFLLRKNRILQENMMSTMGSGTPDPNSSLEDMMLGTQGSISRSSTVDSSNPHNGGNQQISMEEAQRERRVLENTDVGTQISMEEAQRNNGSLTKLDIEKLQSSTMGIDLRSSKKLNAIVINNMINSNTSSVSNPVLSLSLIELAALKFGEDYTLTNANTSQGFLNVSNRSSNAYNETDKYNKDIVSRYDSSFLTGEDDVQRSYSLAHSLAILEEQELLEGEKSDFSIAARTAELYEELIEDTSKFIKSISSMRNDKVFSGESNLSTAIFGG